MPPSQARLRASVLALAAKLGITENDFDAWYKINNKKLIEAGGGSILASCGSSVVNMLRSAFPEHAWDATKFPFKTRNYWKIPQNIVNFLTDVSQKLGIKEGDLEAWYKVSRKDLLDHSGSSPLAAHAGSLLSVLKVAFPLHPWDPYRFSSKQKSFWASHENRVKLLNDIGRKLGILDGHLDAWYEVAHADFRKRGGSPLLTLYEGSLSKVLMGVYPDHSWDLSRFEVKPHNYWKNVENQREFLEKLRVSLKLPENDLNAWYKVTHPLIVQHGGGGFMSYFKGSLYNVLTTLIPEHDWDPDKFERKPRNYWKSLPNQRSAMNQIGTRLGISENDYSAWLSVTNSELIEGGGGYLLSQHNHSLPSLLREVYPEHSWDVDKFSRKPRKYWESPENQKKFVEALEQKLGLKGDLSGWYNVSTADVIANGGIRLLHIHNSHLSEVLKAVYPDHEWDLSKFSKKPKEHWYEVANQISFLNELELKLGINDGNLEKWYKMSNNDIIGAGGSSLLACHQFSIFAMVMALHSDHEWNPKLFSKPRRNSLVTFENQMELLESIREKLGIIEGQYESWYRVSLKDVIKFGGAQLLRYHNFSLASLLMAIYPDHEWHLWKFPKSRLASRNESEVINELVAFTTKNLNLSSHDEWYRITNSQLSEIGAKLGFDSYGGIAKVLRKAYPEHRWDDDSFKALKKETL